MFLFTARFVQVPFDFGKGVIELRRLLPKRLHALAEVATRRRGSSFTILVGVVGHAGNLM